MSHDLIPLGNLILDRHMQVGEGREHLAKDDLGPLHGIEF